MGSCWEMAWENNLRRKDFLFLNALEEKSDQRYRRVVLLIPRSKPV